MPCGHIPSTDFVCVCMCPDKTKQQALKNRESEQKLKVYKEKILKHDHKPKRITLALIAE